LSNKFGKVHAQSLKSAFYQHSDNRGLSLVHSSKRSQDEVIPTYPKTKGTVPEVLAELSASYSSALCTQHCHDIICDDVEEWRFTRRILFTAFCYKMCCQLVSGYLSLPHTWEPGYV